MSPCWLPQDPHLSPCSPRLVSASNYSIRIALWLIGRAVFGAESNFLPALREKPLAGGAPTQA